MYLIKMVDKDYYIDKNVKDKMLLTENSFKAKRYPTRAVAMHELNMIKNYGQDYEIISEFDIQL